MPKMAVPLTFAGVSRRLAGVPMSLKSSGRLSATLSGTGIPAASAASSPYVSTSARRRVKHFTALRAAGRGIDIPALCRRRYEHGSRGRTGFAHRLPRRAYRGRAAGCLHAAQQGIAVELRVGRQHAPAAPASDPPPALRRSASGWRCRCPGPSRHRAWSGRSARRCSMRMKALGAKPSTPAASAPPLANGKRRLSNRPPPAAAPTRRKSAPGETVRRRRSIRAGGEGSDVI